MQVALLFAVALALPSALSPLAPSEPEAEWLVGFEAGSLDSTLRAILSLGGVVEKVSAELRVAVVHADAAGVLASALRLVRGVAYVERSDPTRVHGAEWNGAEWNVVEQNGVEWNGAEWNAATYNGAEWNGVEWNGDPTGAGPDPGQDWLWGLEAVNAPGAWSKSTGTRSATLCVIDSGVAWHHPDLAGNVWTAEDGSHGYNALNESRWPYDDAGHGTHVAGIAAASVANDFGIAGVANVRIMAAKVLDATGRGDEGDLAFALAWCAKSGADVALMALGVTERGPTLDRAIAYAASRDVLLVASAGNAGPCSGCVGYPASDPRVVAVSAVGRDGAPAPFSASGREVELAAPGVDVLGTLPGSRFAFGSGTSQAAAFVAGAATLLRDFAPAMTAKDARAKLAATASDLGATGRDDATGHGLVNVERAIGT